MIVKQKKIVLQKLTFIIPPNSKGYMMDQANGDTIHYLGYCITDLWLEDINRYIKWALDPAKDYIGMNCIVRHLSLPVDDSYLCRSQL